MTWNLRARAALDRLGRLLLCALLACSSEPHETSVGRGSGCDGGVAGPLGSCVSEERPDAGVACTPPGGRCHTTRDCCDAMPCFAPGAAGCGACRSVEDDCDEGRPCPDGALCVTQPPPPCACEPREARRCLPDCREAGCAEDERCRADGVCEPIPCDDGFTCAPGLTCAPGAGDGHGCMRHGCRADAHCPREAPFCVMGECHATLGNCSLPRP